MPHELPAVILCNPKVCSFPLAGIVLNQPIASLAVSKSLAPTVALATPLKRSAYRDLLVLWKTPDPDIPILKQAKAEYAKLLRGRVLSSICR